MIIKILIVIKCTSVNIDRLWVQIHLNTASRLSIIYAITSSVRCWNRFISFALLVFEYCLYCLSDHFLSFLKVILFQDPTCFGLPCCTSQYRCWGRLEKDETPQEV